MSRRSTILILVLAIVMAAGSAMASGFRIPEQGAAAMGMANAWVATADDPTAVAINPAGIVWLEKPAVSAGIMAIAPGMEREDAAGNTSELESQVFTPFNVYGTCPMGTKNLVFGIGVMTPFGLGTEWADDSWARYSSTKSEIQLVDVNPVLAYRITPAFSVAAGVDYYFSNVNLQKKIPWGLATYGATGNPAALGIPDGNFELDGDGDGWGWNAALLYKTDTVSFGLSYRSGVTVDYEGDATLSDVGGVGQLLYGGTSFKTTGKAELDYPAMAQAGVAYKVLPNLRLEADLEWTGWSSYEKLVLDFDSPLVKDSTATKNWDDTYTIRLGAEYTLNPAWDIRAGYLYDKAPIDEKYFDTILPDGEARHGLSIGCGFHAGQFTLDAAYLALFHTEREVENLNPELPFTDVRGTYEGFTSLFALNLTYLF